MWNNIAGSLRASQISGVSGLLLRAKIERQEDCERRTVNGERWPWKRMETHEGDSEFSRVIQFWGNEKGTSAQKGRRKSRGRGKRRVSLVNRWRGVQLGQSRKRGKSEPFLESINSLAPCPYILSFSLLPNCTLLYLSVRSTWEKKSRNKVAPSLCSGYPERSENCSSHSRGLTLRAILYSRRHSLRTHVYVNIQGSLKNYFIYHCCLLEISDETVNIY